MTHKRKYTPTCVECGHPARDDLLCDIHRADYQDYPTAAISPLPSAEIVTSATPPPAPVQN